VKQNVLEVVGRAKRVKLVCGLVWFSDVMSKRSGKLDFWGESAQSAKTDERGEIPTK
jgi:hypothetical protein